MAVTKACRRRVLGHVPSVHDAESAVVRSGAGVDLAEVAAAATSVTTRWFESAARVTLRIDGRERNTAIEDLQVRLVLEHELPDEAGRDGLRKAHYLIVVDDIAATEADGRCEDNAGGCEELDG